MVAFEEVVKDTLLEARPYQRRIVEKARDMFAGRYKNGAGETEPAARSILIESPTGSGKTSMGHLECKILQHMHPDIVFGWVAMRRNLLSQAAKENRDMKIGVSNIHYISMFDKEPEHLVSAKNAGRKLCLVVDEAQHDAASSCAHLHNLLEPDFIIGLSATPFRTDTMKLCFDKVIKDAGIHQLIQDGFLSEYEHYTIPDWTPATVAAHYLREPERWGKSIFYFVTLDKCFELARLLKNAGVVCDVVTGATDCEDQLAAFRAGVLPCLINCMKLTEGFDDPSLETAWVRDSGKGPTMQMAGRAFRKHPLAKTNPQFRLKRVVQSKGTRHPFIKTAMPEQQLLWQDSEWRSLKVNPRLALINHNARMAIAAANAQLPQWLLAKQKKGRAAPWRG